MNLTVSEARAEVAEAANVCSADVRVVEYINRAVRRLLPKGKWVGTVQRYLICATDGCITWPRAVETIEAMLLCESPVVIRNQWFEFLGNGPHKLTEDNPAGVTMVDRGEYPAFDDITGTTKRLRVYSDVAESAAAKITLQGFDENANWIRTQVGGVWIDGEQVTISTTPTLSSKFFTRLVKVIKPKTNGVVRVYEYNNATGLNTKALAFYEPDETLPSYRRSYVPYIASLVGGGGTCDKVTVEVAVKLRYRPVSVDADFILIPNLPALVEMVRAVKKYENNLPTEARAYELLAVQYLQEELKSWQGDGAVVQLRVQEAALFGAGGIESAS